jgi:hypothetical protein
VDFVNKETRMITDVVNVAKACLNIYAEVKAMIDEADENQKDFNGLMKRCGILESVIEQYTSLGKADAVKAQAFTEIEGYFQQLKDLRKKFTSNRQENPKRSLLVSAKNLCNEIRFQAHQLAWRKDYAQQLTKLESKIQGCVGVLGVQYAAQNAARIREDRDQDLVLLQVKAWLPSTLSFTSIFCIFRKTNRPLRN